MTTEQVVEIILITDILSLLFFFLGFKLGKRKTIVTVEKNNITKETEPAKKHKGFVPESTRPTQERKTYNIN